MSYTGIATNFETSRLLSFNLSGSFRELVDCLPYSPYDESQNFLFSNFSIRTESGEWIEFPFVSAKAIYSRVRSAAGIDPDGAIIQIVDKDGKTTVVNFSGFKRGWLAVAVVAVVVIAIVVVAVKTDKATLKGTIKTKDVEADIDIQTGNGASTAPINSSTKTK